MKILLLNATHLGPVGESSSYRHERLLPPTLRGMLVSDTHTSREIKSEKKGDRKYGKKSAAKELLEKVCDSLSISAASFNRRLSSL